MMYILGVRVSNHDSEPVTITINKNCDFNTVSASISGSFEVCNGKLLGNLDISDVKNVSSESSEVLQLLLEIHHLLS